MRLDWIVFAALLIAFAIFAGVTTYWQDIVAQPPSAAAFLGALAGAGGGLLAIILGALLNAELNRRRDDRLRAELARTLATGLRAELITLMAEAGTRHGIAERLRTADGPVNPAQIVRLDIPAKKIFDSNTRHLGDLGKFAAIAVIAAHTVSDQIRNDVAAARVGEPDDFVVHYHLQEFGGNLRELFRKATEGVNALDAFLGESPTYPDQGLVFDQVKSAAEAAREQISAK